jgi:hypothetical protein
MSWKWKIYPLAPQEPPGYILPKQTHILKFQAIHNDHDASTDVLCTSSVDFSQELAEVSFACELLESYYVRMRAL